LKENRALFPFFVPQIIRDPSLSLTAVLSLAVGMGATVAVYGMGGPSLES
jgi:hypothetical protein